MEGRIEETRRPGRLRTAVVAVLVALFGWSLYGLGRAQGADETPAPHATDEPAAAVAERLAASVVRIEHGGGQGSGVVYDDGGMILTAGHVVDGVSEVEVRTSAGDSLEGEVLGTDPATDIAVVDVDADLPVPELATDDDPRVGQVAVAIGSPYGLDETVTMGIVSALDRSVTTGAGTIDGVIQTDAPINPGNSGGPLADKDGRVIGINHAIASSSGGNEGVGFAIPVGDALDSADAIVAGDVEDGPGLLPEMPFPDHPFGGFPPLDEELPPLHGKLPGNCLPHDVGEPFAEVFPGAPRFRPPDLPRASYLPEGWQTVSVMTNTLDDDAQVIHEIELASGADRMAITLGDAPSVLDRAEELRRRSDARPTRVDGEPASLVEDADRLYLVFDHGDLTGVIDAPAAVGSSELVRIAEGIRR